MPFLDDSDPEDFELADEPYSERVYRPRGSRSIGWVRRRDIEDREAQTRAPRDRYGRYDRTGAERFARGAEAFEHDAGVPRTRSYDVVHGKWEDAPVSYAGRGPQKYRRSDARILEDVCDELTAAPDVDATEIDVAVTDGIVSLRGTVESRQSKRRADDIAAYVPGVRDVENHLRITTPL